MKRYPFTASIIAILASILFSAQFAAVARAEGATPVAGVEGTVRVERVEADGAGAVTRRAAPPSVDGVPRTMGMERTPKGTSIPRLYTSSSAKVSLPAAHDLTIPALPVGNQGSQSSCVGWAVGYYYKTYQEAFQHRWDVSRTDRQFSPAWVYNQICGGRDEGSTFNRAFRLLIDSGIVDMQEFPYGANNYTDMPTSAQKEAAKPYRVSSYAALWYQAGGNDVRDVKARIAAGEPVVLGVPVYDSFYYSSGGWVDIPGASESNYGDHAVCAVGYDDSAGGGKGGIKIVNSWGTRWGDGGYGYLSYDFVAGYCWEAWVATDRPADRPTVNSMTPRGGHAGTEVAIAGDNFGAKRGEAAVKFNGVAGTVTYWNNSGINVRVPTGATDGGVNVVNWAGEQSGGVAFDADLSLNSVDPGVARGGDEVRIRGVGLGAKAGRLKMGSTSVQVVSWTDGEITFRAPAVPCSGDLTASIDGRSSNSLPFSVVGAMWYLAEGSTGPGFETWVLVQNPNDAAANVSLTYMTPAGKVSGPSVALPPNSRKTFNVADTVPGQFEVSTRVTADRPVVAERAMYGNGRTWGTDSVGVASAAKTWYLAEGSTGDGTETWVLVANPGDSEARMSLTYMTPSGKVAGPSVALPPNSRKTFNVADTVPGQYEVSTKVESNRPVTVERAEYGNNRAWGHDSTGSPQ